jgi:hypothetical protein
MTRCRTSCTPLKAAIDKEIQDAQANAATTTGLAKVTAA